ncbi:MAG: homocysteine S-methyltransferase family protein [Chloroflexia bacterium]|nr:homocysteine S-methyltransferase family protein [Chloroflexia bacterium]
MANCIHPSNLIRALLVEQNFNHPQINRFLGIQSNTSALSPEELNGCGFLHQDDFDNIISEMLILRKDFNLKIFGGCCGTNDTFIAKLAEKLLMSKFN